MKSEKSSLLRNSFNKCGPSTWVSWVGPSQVTFKVLRGAGRQIDRQEPRQHVISGHKKSPEENRVAYMTREPRDCKDFYLVSIETQWLKQQFVGSQVMWVRNLRQFIW